MSKTPFKTPKKDPKANLRRWWFEKEQPSPQAKREGRERKKQAQIIMDKMLKYSEMTVEQLEDEIKNKGKKMSVQDYLITKYVTSGTKSEKMLVDWMDRHIAKAPTQMEIDQNINMNVNLKEMSAEELLALVTGWQV